MSTTVSTPRKIAATVSAAATLAKGRHTPVDATAAALTMTLPTDAVAGVEVSVEKVDAGANAVTVSGTMRGVAAQTITLTTQYEARTFLSEGAGSWRPVSDHRTATALSATYAGVGTRASQDTMRATRDRAYRTWDAQVADPTVTPYLFVYGHSVVAGTGASDTYHKFTTLLRGRVSGKRSNAVLADDGVGGNTTANLLSRLSTSAIASQPAGSVGATVIMGLLNDYTLNVDPNTTKTNLTSLISALRAHASAAPNMTVVIALEWLRSDTTSPAYPWSAYQAVAKAVADADVNTTVMDLGSRVGNVAGATLPIWSDGAHPNDRGHALVAALLDAELMRGQGLPAVPAQTMILAGLPPVSQSGWAGLTRDTDNQFLRYSDGVQNNSITYSFVGDAGHYDVMLDHRQQANGGKYDLYLDGVKQGAGGQWDGYAAANVDSSSTVSGFYVPTSGAHQAKLVMATKNASSSAYAGVIRGIYLTRTGV